VPLGVEATCDVVDPTWTIHEDGWYDFSLREH